MTGREQFMVTVPEVVLFHVSRGKTYLVMESLSVLLNRGIRDYLRGKRPEEKNVVPSVPASETTANQDKGDVWIGRQLGGETDRRKERQIGEQRQIGGQADR